MRKLGLFSALGCLSIAASAQAHIRIDNYETRDGDAQKTAPCGSGTSVWGAGKTFNFEPGATVSLTVNEYIPHPGYFRVSFDKDGDDGFKDPVSIFPIDPARTHVNDRDQDKGTDFCSNDTVLKDNIEAHLGEAAAVHTIEVKLPDIECEKCVIQVIQVMEDTIHGPYNVKTEGFLDLPDLYHQCVDVTLTKKKGAKAPSGDWPKCSIGELVGNQKNAPKQSGGSTGGSSGGSTGSSDGGQSTPDQPGQTPNDSPDDGTTGEHEHDDGSHDAGSASSGGSSGGKKDASSPTKKDGSTPGKDDQEEEAAAKTDDGGCAVPSTRTDLAWLALALGMLVRRRAKR